MRVSNFAYWWGLSLLCAAHPDAHPNAHPIAQPNAHPNAQPNAQPNAHPIAQPNAQPKAQPIAHPKANPQQFTNNAPFSGAIYIVYPNGQEVTGVETNQCPSFASQSCGNIGHPSWCCAGGYTCASPETLGGACGCCPAGSSCGGTINVASVTTVTVQAAPQTEVVYIQPPPTTVAVYNQPQNPTQYHPQQGGFCQTLTMDGPGLPTTREAECGTILIVNEASIGLKPLGFGIGAFILMIHVVLGRMFRFI
ncbi:hypothetical protein BU24DRAFT_404108 [Aaosphaeria arxii CBS 175.79]|uniref:Carbohydrate-binding module family 18 protein n=1 Tax=Aaosphaeria arxii CBS 175.79 TaxID=1450172 RepID=A0A6A5Y669_9PLEO|nr:uncharacterized protein BU24DRAFT_404108 [Aaosphaeria arxii CBS 175.79]KAF2021055.1 hypothetical protein BU24DRAFT_404108 [Aaosphaeria arxii CBS 175.79]